MLYKSINEEMLDLKRKIKSNNINRTIALLGTKSGVGVTHTAIMLSHFLSKNKKVALLELNSNNSFKELEQIINGKNSVDDFFTYNKVDYYGSVNFTEFNKYHRDRYCYIIIDFGCYENLYDIDEYIRADNKLVIAHGIDWKIGETIRFYNNTRKYDPNCKWNYLIPFLLKKDIKDISNEINNKIYTIPFNKNPFVINYEVKKVFGELV